MGRGRGRGGVYLVCEGILTLSLEWPSGSEDKTRDQAMIGTNTRRSSWHLAEAVEYDTM